MQVRHKAYIAYYSKSHLMKVLCRDLLDSVMYHIKVKEYFCKAQLWFQLVQLLSPWCLLWVSHFWTHVVYKPSLLVFLSFINKHHPGVPESVRPECWELLQGLFPSRASLSTPALTQPLTKWSDVLSLSLSHLAHPLCVTRRLLLFPGMQLPLGPWPCTLCAPFCGWGEELLPLAGSALWRQNRARSLSLQLGERPHSSWHWTEWQQLMWDRMCPWPLWPHPRAAVMWQCTPIHCAFILLLSCHWSWTSMPSKYTHFSRTSPDPGCASRIWPGTRDFIESYPSWNRSHCPSTCLLGKENYIAAPCIYS